MTGQGNHPPLRLYLSGGSNRSALASVGAILFLTRNGEGGLKINGTTSVADAQYRWQDVDELVSISGGSMPTAALMIESRNGANEDHVGALRSFYESLLSQSQHFTTVGRKRLLAKLAVLAALPLIGLATCVVLLWTAAAVAAAVLPIAFVIGLVLMAFIYRKGADLLSKYLENMLEAILGAESKSGLKDIAKKASSAQPRSYLIGTAGMASGTNHFYWMRAGATTANSTERIARASMASCSLPPLSQRGDPPRKLERDSGQLVSVPIDLPDEALLDGGYGGNFGLQVTQHVLQEIADVGSTNRRVLAVDAGRPIRNSDGIAALGRKISTVVRLLRIIQVGNNALYENDIQDLEDVSGGMIVVARTGADASPDAIRSAFRLAVHGNAELGLIGVTKQKAALAVLVGVVGCYLAEIEERASATANALAPNNTELKAVLKVIDADLGITNAAPNLQSEWARALNATTTGWEIGKAGTFTLSGQEGTWEDLP